MTGQSLGIKPKASNHIAVNTPTMSYDYPATTQHFPSIVELDWSYIQQPTTIVHVISSDMLSYMLYMTEHSS